MLAPCLIDGDPMFLAPIAHLRALSRLATLTALACGTLVLNGCGGGDRATPYVPTRMVSFGDENSLIDTFNESSPSKLFQTDGTTPGAVKGLVYTVNTVALAPIDGNAQGFFYVCADNAITGYAPCNNSNATGGSVTTIASNQWFSDPDFANRLIRVEHDTTTQKRLDALYAWNCSGSVIWTQVIAHAFRLGYANYNGTVGQCPTDGYSNAYTYAEYGKDSAAVVTQIDAHLNELGSGTLVTVMAGQWDIINLYKQIKLGTKTQAEAEAELRGRAGNLANAVVSVINQGAKVVVALTPDLGESPMAYNAGDTVLLKALTTAFNDALYINNLADQKKVPKGGRVVAGVNPETLTNTSTRSTSYVYAPNVLCPAVDSNDAATSTTSLQDPVGTKVLSSYPGYDANAAVKFCNTATTTLASTAGTYMWADSIHLSPLGHGSIGSSGYTRASNQF
jgi:hypothetical protein